MAVVAVVLAGGIYLGDQHVAAQGRGGFGGPGRFGGPGGPDGPMGRGGRGGPGGPDGGVLGPLMLNRLDLSDSQRDRVRQILDAQRDARQALNDRAIAAHQALDATLTGSPLDEAAIRGKAADVAAVEADVAVARGRVYSEVLQVLSADQQKKLSTLQAEQKDRMEKRRAARDDKR